MEGFFGDGRVTESVLHGVCSFGRTFHMHGPLPRTNGVEEKTTSESVPASRCRDRLYCGIYSCRRSFVNHASVPACRCRGGLYEVLRSCFQKLSTDAFEYRQELWPLRDDLRLGRMREAISCRGSRGRRRSLQPFP